MIKKLSKKHHIFKFSKDNQPVLSIKNGDMVEIETMDCFSNQIKKADDVLDAMDWDRVNPATGPIYIEEAKAGDVLKVTIEKIDIADRGTIATGKDLGVLGDRLDGLNCKVVKIQDDHVLFDDILKIPLNKMVGVIGVAPKGEGINCGTPDRHGGNMDNKMVSENSTIYFPIQIDGALFALGDIHAAMGDGEIGVSGVEVAGKVTVKFEVLKEFSLNNPLLENENSISTIASKESLDDAVKEAVSEMEKFLSTRIKLETPDMSMLFSVVGNVEVCQVVDPLKTARFVMPKWVLEKYGFDLLKEDV
ncbi:acetamidase/formamidase family protein [Wukongibacter baidiensis]|uniref:acetamidase/formamidase family protein n=1 Tax=Wukongibacter baidiensis TaxID=1723361 RepID=UPI003D7F3E4C